MTVKSIRDITKMVEAEDLILVETNLTGKGGLRAVVKDAAGNEKDFIFSTGAGADPANDRKNRSDIRRWKRDILAKNKGVMAEALAKAVQKAPANSKVLDVVADTKGVELDTYCENGNMMAKISDGKGGSTITIKYLASPECAGNALVTPDTKKAKLQGHFNLVLTAVQLLVDRASIKLVRSELVDEHGEFELAHPGAYSQRVFKTGVRFDGSAKTLTREMMSWIKMLDDRGGKACHDACTPRGVKDLAAFEEMYAHMCTITKVDDTTRADVYQGVQSLMGVPAGSKLIDMTDEQLWKQFGILRGLVGSQITATREIHEREEAARLEREAQAQARKEGERKKREETEKLLADARAKRAQQLAVRKQAEKAPPAPTANEAPLKEEEVAILKYVRDYENMVRDEGMFIVSKKTTGTNHYKYVIGDGKNHEKIFVISCTPSDRATVRLNRAEIKRWWRECQVLQRNEAEGITATTGVIAPSQEAAQAYHEKPVSTVVAVPPAPSPEAQASVQAPASAPQEPTATPAPAAEAPAPRGPAQSGRAYNKQDYETAFKMLTDDAGFTGERYRSSTSELIQVRNWLVDHPKQLFDGTSLLAIGIHAMLELSIPVAVNNISKLVKALRDEAKLGPLKKAVDYTANLPQQQSAQMQIEGTAPVVTTPAAAPSAVSVGMTQIEKEFDSTKPASAPRTLESMMVGLPTGEDHSQNEWVKTFWNRPTDVDSATPVKDPAAETTPVDTNTTAIERIAALEQQVRMLTKTVSTLSRLQGMDLPEALRDLLKDL